MKSQLTVVWGRFVWHAEKERANKTKQRIGFQLAVQAFLDPDRIVAPDEKHSHQEERWFCIGKVGCDIVTVRFTYRGKQIRIIGAGLWRKERKLYETKISTRS